jgi:excisionase family DNA binding protein
MNTSIMNHNDRLLRFLTATPEQQEAIDRILEGKAERAPEPQAPKGPLLLRVKDAALLLGVHRTTMWRLVKAGRLETVELLGSLRVRRADVEGLAGGNRAAGKEGK